MSDDFTEKRGGRWSDDDDKEIARRLAQQAEKDRLAQEAAKEKEKQKEQQSGQD